MYDDVCNIMDILDLPTRQYTVYSKNCNIKASMNASIIVIQ